MADLTLPGAGEASGGTRSALAQLPSIDRLLNEPRCAELVAQHGAVFVKRAAQATLQHARERIQAGAAALSLDDCVGEIETRLRPALASRLQPVFNLSGTVIHTNLGRSLLAEEAIDAVAASMRGFVALEYDVDSGERGDRDDIVAELLCSLTGAEDATVVNNCAAAVLLTLKALAARREVVISRGELIEIGGAFRMPDIMKAAGCRLIEVGTTNRTHERDYAEALTPRTALVMTAHASNFEVRGFTAAVDAATIAAMAHAHGVPYVVDLGSGALIDLSAYGLRREPMPEDALTAGADLVMFSGDKLLGGPQAGIVVGRRDLIRKLKKDPLKRAVRVSKLALAALEATLRIIDSGHRVAERLPTLGLLTRSSEDIRATCLRMLPTLAEWAGTGFDVRVADCASQIGSGSQPVEKLASAALVIAPRGKVRGRVVAALESRLRTLAVPVVGRVHDNAVWLDCRCLLAADEADFAANLRTA